MSITQQLARLDEGLIDQCRRDARRLDDLCSFRLVEPDDHLDLDWSPALLDCAARVARLSDDRLATLALATVGEHEIDPAHRTTPDSIWQHPVTVNSPDQVRHVHATLQLLFDDGFPTAEAAQASVAQLGIGVAPADAPGYLRGHFDALHDFYAVAAARGLHTVMWWD